MRWAWLPLVLALTAGCEARDRLVQRAAEASLEVHGSSVRAVCLYTPIGTAARIYETEDEWTKYRDFCNMALGQQPAIPATVPDDAE